MSNSLWTMGSVTAVVVILLNMTVGADVGVEANPLLGGGASGSDVSFIVGSEGDLTIEFEQQTLFDRPSLNYGEAQPSAQLSPTWQSFTGNYLEDGVKGLQFRIRNNGDVLPSSFRISVFNENTGSWEFDSIRIDPAGKEWVTNTIVFDRRVGWNRMMKYATEEEKQAHFESTLSGVSSLSVYVQHDAVNREKLQSVTISDFVLFGDGWMSDEGKLAVGLVENFGVMSRGDLSPDQLTQDSDRDGVSDVDAIQSGSDPGLAIQVAGIGPSGVILEWPCVENKLYTVLRADSLNGDFAAIDVVQAGQNGYMQYTDSEATAGSGPYYYKVQKRAE